MNILTLHNPAGNTDGLNEAIMEAEPGAELVSFSDAKHALSFLRENPCDVAFLPLCAEDPDGLRLGEEMSALQQKLNIIFVSDGPEGAAAAFALHASGFLLRPVDADHVRTELAHLRYHREAGSAHALRVTTFGNFEVFFHDRPVKMREKAKELFAFLIDRSGALVSNNEIYGVLFEDEPGHEENLKKIKKSLVDALHKLGEDAVLVVSRGHLAVNPEAFDCDLYLWRKGDKDAAGMYRGEYMSQYSWAECSVSEFMKL